MNSTYIDIYCIHKDSYDPNWQQKEISLLNNMDNQKKSYDIFIQIALNLEVLNYKQLLQAHHTIKKIELEILIKKKNWISKVFLKIYCIRCLDLCLRKLIANQTWYFKDLKIQSHIPSRIGAFLPACLSSCFCVSAVLTLLFSKMILHLWDYLNSTGFGGN